MPPYLFVFFSVGFFQNLGAAVIIFSTNLSAMPLLDYYKVILDKVSFYPDLFVKEYGKAQRHLDASDVGNLNQWINTRGFQALLKVRTAPKVRVLSH